MRYGEELECNGWRYCVQRQRVRHDGVYYSLLVAPPTKAEGYLDGVEAMRAIMPVSGESAGTKRGVMALIKRHCAYISLQHSMR